jgi:Fn3 associated
MNSTILWCGVLALTSGCALRAPPLDSESGQAGGEAGGQAGSSTSIPSVDGCWQLPAVNRVRLFPVAGKADALKDGKIVGSFASATNNFEDIALVTQAPAEGEWLELTFYNDRAYRFVKYYGPPGSHGVVAEVELYEDDVRLTGKGFGTAGEGGSLVNGFALALDGDESTGFEGPLPSDNYVGLDLGAEHTLAAPSFTPSGGAVIVGTSITLEAEPDTTLSYTTDGSDPRGGGTPYTGPIVLPVGTTLLKAAASKDCALDSTVTQAAYSVVTSLDPGAPTVQSSTQSSLHIGNSLTDTIVDRLETLASDGGIALDFNRYTIPGSGTWMYDTNPTGGFGVANVQETMRSRPFDHVSMQPYPNGPCQPLASTSGEEFGPDSDSGFLNQAWTDAQTQNPKVQFWVYQQWPAPVDYVDCMTGGGWTRGEWSPTAPQSWEDGVATGLIYQEVVRGELARLNPAAPAPYIIPGGLALVALKHAIEAGQVPGMSDFFGTMFEAGGTDIHMTTPGAYYITLVFYACMFQRTPEGRINDTNGALTSEQAAIFQQLAWETVKGYPFSGLLR